MCDPQSHRDSSQSGTSSRDPSPFNKSPRNKSHCGLQQCCLALLIGIFLNFAISVSHAYAEANLIPLKATHDQGFSRITLEWGSPVGWEIRSSTENTSKIIFYKKGSADLSNLDLEALPEVLDFRQQQNGDTLELTVIISEGSTLKVSWSQNNTSTIDVIPELVPTNLLYNKQRDLRKTSAAQTAHSITPAAPTTVGVTHSGPIAPPPINGGGPATDIFADSDPAFEGAIDQLLPLTPDQIEAFGRSIQDQEDAVFNAYEKAPVAVVRPLPISLASDAAVEGINLATNHITTVIFLDATGQPWPINTVAVGEAFTLVGFAQESGISTYDLEGAHEIRLIPKKRLKHGNISISLRGLPTPVVLRLEAARDKADYRVDIRIPEYGPNADKPIIDVPDQIESANATILDFLSGAPPKSAEVLRLTGAPLSTRAWKHEGQIWLKTKSTLMSPGYSQRVGAADGTFVYAMRSTPVVIVSDNGVQRKFRISTGAL